MGFDVHALTSSDFYAKFGNEGEPDDVDALAELEKKTGLNPARDIDSVVIALKASPASDKAKQGPENALIFVTGRFDAARLESSIPDSGKATKERRDGVTIYREATGRIGPVALLDAGILVAGDSASVEAFLANRQSGHGVRDSKELVSLPPRERRAGFDVLGGGRALGALPCDRRCRRAGRKSPQREAGRGLRSPRS